MFTPGDLPWGSIIFPLSLIHRMPFSTGGEKVRVLDVEFLNLYYSRGAFGHELRDILELVTERLPKGGYV